MAWWWSKWLKLVATNGIIKLYVKLKTYTIINVFQFYNTTGCSLQNKKKRQCWSIALLICIISCGQYNSQHSDIVGWTVQGSNPGTDKGVFFHTHPDQQWDTPSSLPWWVPWPIPRGEAAGAWCWILTPYLVLRLSMSKAVPLFLPPCLSWHVTFTLPSKGGISNICLLHNAKR